MIKLRDRIYYKILPFVLGLIGHYEAAEYRWRKYALPKNTHLPGNNHLFLTHGRGGGVDKFVEDMAANVAADKKQAWILHFNPLKRKFFLSRLKIHSSHSIAFRFPSQYWEMMAHLRSLELGRLHIHHTRYLPYYFVKDLPAFAEALEVTYDYTMHDFIAFCPRVHLIDGDFHYCGMPLKASICNACVRKKGFLTTAPRDVEKWRETNRSLLIRASELIAPSHDTAERHQRILGRLDIKVVPHDSPKTNPHKFPAKLEGEPYVVTIIGRIHRHKGADIVLACAQDIIDRNLPLRFVIIGDSVNGKKLRNTGVVITGIYKEDDLPYLLKKSGASLVFLPSIWPETYSYVLSHIWENGYFPVAFDLGAPAERIKQAGCGLVLPANMIRSPSEINDALLAAAKQQHE